MSEPCAFCTVARARFQLWRVAIAIAILRVGVASAFHGPTDDARHLLDQLRIREDAIAAALRYSEWRTRWAEQLNDPTDTEPRTRSSRVFFKRQPELVRASTAHLREGAENLTETWDPTVPDWTQIASLQEFRITPSDAFMLVQRRANPLQPNSDEPDETNLTTFEPFPWSASHRYEAPTVSPYSTYCGFLPGQNATISEVLLDPSTTSRVDRRAELDGIACLVLSAKAKTGSYEIWLDDRFQVRKLTAQREAFDEYYGTLIWKFELLGEDARAHDRPNEGERSAYLHEVYRYSDFREPVNGISIPYRVEVSIERRAPTGRVHRSLGRGNIDGLWIQNAPFSRAEMALDVPDGTTVYRSPLDGVPRTWRSGGIITVVDERAVASIDKAATSPAITELAVTHPATITRFYWIVIAVLLVLFSFVAVITYTRRRTVPR